MSDIIPEVSIQTPECPRPQLWHCYDGMATEVEVLDFIKALVVLTKPTIILETGTYLGYGTIRLAIGCKENGFGHVYTAEVDPNFYKMALQRFEQSDFNQYITAGEITGVGMIHEIKDTIDFAFLDSNLDTRLPEMEALFPKLSPTGTVVVHDTGTQHDGYIGGGPRTKMRNFAAAHGMQLINFSTPRGVCVMRKFFR